VLGDGRQHCENAALHANYAAPNPKENSVFPGAIMSSHDKTSKAALWLAEQLARPIDYQDDDTKVLSGEEIRERFGGHNNIDIEEITENYHRVLTWREKQVKGRALDLRLSEIIRIRYRFTPGFSASPPSLADAIGVDRLHTMHRLFIAILDHEKDDSKILADITVSSEAWPKSETPWDETDIVINSQRFSGDDIALVLKAWLHQGGSLDDLEGIPSYLCEE
jgi:hypothetical protein